MTLGTPGPNLLVCRRSVVRDRVWCGLPLQCNQAKETGTQHFGLGMGLGTGSKHPTRTLRATQATFFRRATKIRRSRLLAYTTRSMQKTAQTNKGCQGLASATSYISNQLRAAKGYPRGRPNFLKMVMPPMRTTLPSRASWSGKVFGINKSP